MKTNDLITLALAGIAVWLIARTRTATGAAVPLSSINPLSSLFGNTRIQPSSVFPTEISNTALPGQPGYGWTYFSDGTVIGPDGTYYYNGAKVWTP